MNRRRRVRHKLTVNDDGDMVVEKHCEPLSQLCHRNAKISVIQFAVDQGKQDVNQTDIAGLTPLMIVVKIGNVPALNFLLCRAALINQRDRKKKTALYYAVHHVNQPISAKMIKILLLHGACRMFSDITLDVAIYPLTMYEIVLAGKTKEVEVKFNRGEFLPCLYDNAGRSVLLMLLQDSEPKTTWIEDMSFLLLKCGAKQEELVYHVQ